MLSSEKATLIDLSKKSNVFPTKIGSTIFLENLEVTSAYFGNFANKDYLVSFKAPVEIVESLNLITESISEEVDMSSYHNPFKESGTACASTTEETSPLVTIKYRKGSSGNLAWPTISGNFMVPGSLNKTEICYTQLKKGTKINLECQWAFWKNHLQWGWKLVPLRLQLIQECTGDLGRSLLETCDYPRPITDKETINLFLRSLEKRLECFNPDLKLSDLNWILEKTKGYLTGSFLLATLLESDYFLRSSGPKKCDLDIFMPADVNPVYYAKKVWGNDCLEKELTMSSYNPLKDVYSMISQVINLKNGIQFIQVDPEHYSSIPEYINNYFDLSIIRGAYSPGALYPPPEIERLYRGMGEVSRTLGPMIPSQRAKRVEKYRLRGFWISDLERKYSCPECELHSGVFYRSKCGHLVHLQGCRNGGQLLKEYGQTSQIVKQCYDCYREEKQRIEMAITDSIDKHLELGKELLIQLHREFNKGVPFPIQIQLLTLRYGKVVNEAFLEYEGAQRSKIALVREYEVSYLLDQNRQGRDRLLKDLESRSYKEISLLLDQAGSLQGSLRRQFAQFKGYRLGSSPLEEFTRPKCSICDLVATRLFLPCGHYNSCQSCSDEILRTSKKCPVCRSKIENSIEVFI